MNDVIIPSNPEDRAAIKSSLEEISNVMTMIEAKRDFIREEIKALSEKYKIPAKLLRKMAYAYHRQNFHEEKQSLDLFEELYETIIGQ